MKISLILPVYNPAEGWADIVLNKTDELIRLYPDLEFEVIVVDDGSSPDIFREGFHSFNKSYINILGYKLNRGKGHALRTGVSASTGDIVVYTDIDFPYTIQSVSGVIDVLRIGEADIVIGIKDQTYYDQVPPLRRFISKIFRFFIRLFLRIPTDDTQCGLKGFNKKGREIFLKTTIDRYLFDLEFVFLSSRERTVKFKIQKIQLRPDVYFRKMNFGIIKSELWNFFKILMYS